MLVVQSDNEKEYGSMEVAGTINKKVCNIKLESISFLVISEKKGKY